MNAPMCFAVKPPRRIDLAALLAESVVMASALGVFRVIA